MFRESDLQWVLAEFQRAATHARSYWEKYDARVRRYILQHTNAECLRRIGKWKDKGNRVAVGAVDGPQQRPLLMQAPLSERSENVPWPEDQLGAELVVSLEEDVR